MNAKQEARLKELENQLLNPEDNPNAKQPPVLPQYPKTPKEWSLKCRPIIDGRKNILQYMPFLQRYLEDLHPSKQTIFARQTGKSTTIATEMGCDTTTNPGWHANYTTYEDESLSTFSNIKFRQGLWNTDPVRMFVVGSTLGEVGRILLKNGSVNTLVTHAHKWKHLEGKSVDSNYLDEAQYLDWDNYARAKETQSFTQGKERIYGIGGFVNTPYHKLWNGTDQREWEYHKELWREGLEFNDDGLIWDDYLLDLLEGHWEAKAPQNHFRHGYHMSQLLFPHIPLTMKDAEEKYKVSPEFSVEWKQKHYSSIEFAQHVEAKFVEGDIKPITDSMMFKLYDRTLSYTQPEDVDRKLGDVFTGVDWGGGNKTIVWDSQFVGDEMILLNVEQIETSDLDRQFDIVKGHIDSYKPKQCVVDAGGGTYQVQQLEKRYASLVRRNSYLTRPEAPLPTNQESKKLRKENRYTIDRTYSLDRVVNRIQNKKMKIPAATDNDRKISDWIVEDFTNIEVELVKLKSTGQTYRRYFNPVGRPSDALHSCNYNEIAHDISKNKEWYWVSG